MPNQKLVEGVSTPWNGMAAYDLGDPPSIFIDATWPRKYDNEYAQAKAQNKVWCYVYWSSEGPTIAPSTNLGHVRAGWPRGPVYQLAQLVPSLPPEDPLAPTPLGTLSADTTVTAWYLEADSEGGPIVLVAACKDGDPTALFDVGVGVGVHAYPNPIASCDPPSAGKAKEAPYVPGSPFFSVQNDGQSPTITARDIINEAGIDWHFAGWFPYDNTQQLAIAQAALNDPPTEPPVFPPFVTDGHRITVPANIFATVFANYVRKSAVQVPPGVQAASDPYVTVLLEGGDGGGYSWKLSDLVAGNFKPQHIHPYPAYDALLFERNAIEHAGELQHLAGSTAPGARAQLANLLEQIVAKSAGRNRLDEA